MPISREKQDAMTVRGIMDRFLKSEPIQNRLRFILTKDINDWEKWLQLELQYFMTTIDGIEVEKEVSAIPDRRKLKDRYGMYVDLAFKRQRTRKNSYIFLELKCAKDAHKLIKGFHRDVKKINSIRSCTLSHESFWCVGFHLDCTEKSVNKIQTEVSSWKYGYNEIIKVCDCNEDFECECEDNKIGFAII